MPSVFIVPVYVEIPAGFERAVATLESYLRRAGYKFHVGQPSPDLSGDTKTIAPDNGGVSLPTGNGEMESRRSP